MRAVLQRVTEARVCVDGKTVGEIGGGLMVLLGVAKGDAHEDAVYLAGKIANLRIFGDETGKMNRSLIDTGGGALVVPQFTLYGDCRKGRRPAFDEAAAPDAAEKLYLDFVSELRRMGVGTETGVFRSHMKVSLTNDGPVTLVCETKNKG